MRLAAAWLVLAVLAAGGGGLIALGERAPSAPVPARPLPAAATATVTATPTPEAAAHHRRKPRMPRGHDARAVLRRALLKHAITRTDWRRWHLILMRAHTAARRLAGARGTEMRAVLAGVEGLAAAHRLTVSRMPLAFLTLERNTTVWRFRPFPHAAERFTFGRDPAVFQYFPGHGVQFHPLATAGRANALAVPCLSEHETCHRRTLAKRLDRLVSLASSRGGFTAWEYTFAFGGGGPYWISAMSQATAAQALARGAKALDRPDYARVALSALGAFDVAAPLGVRGGGQYVMYSFSPHYQILNGFLQSVIGLHDVAELTGSHHALRLYRRGERAARRAVRAFDTGAWSRYSLDGPESTLSYHELLTGFLQGLCDRTGHAVYCDTAERFTRYEREPPRIHLAVTRKPRADRAAALSFWLSKVSSVSVVVRGRHGAVLARSGQLPRGRFRYVWTPPRAGRYTVVVRATGLAGHTGVARESVDAKAKPKPRRRARRRGATRPRRGADSARRAPRAASPS